MNITISITENFNSVDAFELFARRLHDALSGLKPFTTAAPVVVSPAAIAASAVAPPSDAPQADGAIAADDSFKSVPSVPAAPPSAPITDEPKRRRGRPPNAERSAVAAPALPFAEPAAPKPNVPPPPASVERVAPLNAGVAGSATPVVDYSEVTVFHDAVRSLGTQLIQKHGPPGMTSAILEFAKAIGKAEIDRPSKISDPIERAKFVAHLQAKLAA